MDILPEGLIIAIIYKTPSTGMQAASSPVVSQVLLDKIPPGFKSPMFAFNGTQWEMVSGFQKIIQDMLSVLNTSVGRRFNQPDFGSELIYMMDENYESQTKTELIFATKTALATWCSDEIVVSDCEIDETYIQQGIVIINIFFYVLGTSEPFTLGLPQATQLGIRIPLNLYTINGKQIFTTQVAA